nr:MerR family DNA-binding protein [Mesorhizobium sp.]
MNGDAAQRSGLPAKTIRYYEEIGLIRQARAGNGYRDYCGDDIHRLTFLRRARNLGFSIDDCRQLMALYRDRSRDRSRASHDVREIAAAQVTAIEEKVRELQSMRSTLQKLIHACHGDDRPDCPILEDIAGLRRLEIKSLPRLHERLASDAPRGRKGALRPRRAIPDRLCLPKRLHRLFDA